MYLNHILTDSEGNKCLTIIWTKFENSDHSDTYNNITSCVLIDDHDYVWVTIFVIVGEKKRTKPLSTFTQQPSFLKKKRIIIFCHELMCYTAVPELFFVNRKRKLKCRKESVKLIRTFTFKIPHLRIFENICHNRFMNLTLSSSFLCFQR